MQQQDDAANELATRYMPWARRVALDMLASHPRLDEGDGTCEAYLGLVEASRRFDPGRGVSFPTYARAYVESRVIAYIDTSRYGMIGGIPRRLKDAARRVRRAAAVLAAAGEEVTIERLAHASGESRRYVVRAMMLPRMSVSTADVEDDEPGGDGIADEVWDALDHCTAREREVMGRRFGLDGLGERSRGDVADELGTDVRSVRKAEESAGRKLAGRLGLAMA